jgi:hypothetical protein
VASSHCHVAALAAALVAVAAVAVATLAAAVTALAAVAATVTVASVVVAVTAAALLGRVGGVLLVRGVLWLIRALEPGALDGPDVSSYLRDDPLESSESLDDAGGKVGAGEPSDSEENSSSEYSESPKSSEGGVGSHLRLSPEWCEEPPPFLLLPMVEWKEEEESKQQAAVRNVKMPEKQEHYL